MENNTKKFGLLIVDDEQRIRELYKKIFNEHNILNERNILKDIWNSIESCENGESALRYIENYKNTNDYHLLVIADAYMGPNCENNNIIDRSDLFGGLWLIDKVNRDVSLKKFVTILLTTYYDNKILYYRNKKMKQFQWTEGKDYYFVEKPRANTRIKNQIEATEALSNIKEPEEIRKTFEKTFEAINDILKLKEDEELQAFSMATETSYNQIVGTSEKIKKSIDISKLAAKSDAAVLLLGESGTGKGVFARFIHNKSQRREKPLVLVNCAAIPDGLLESEMFGHVKGSFTGAAKDSIGRFMFADKGTIFLDEIAEIPLNLQPKILRVLQEMQFERVGENETKTVDVRIIAATNQNLKDLVSNGKFREDLFYRLNVIPITLPPLRERKEDIPLLVEQFLEEFNKKNSKRCNIAPDVFELFLGYNWPGNIRELENLIQRLVVLSVKTTIDVIDVREKFYELKHPSKPKVIFNDFLSFAELEKEYFNFILKRVKGNKNQAAQIADIHASTVDNKIKYYNLTEFIK